MKTEEISICPFRTYTEVRPAITYGQGDVTVTGFMDCLKSKCPAWYSKDEYISGTGVGVIKEHCKRLG